MLLPDSPWSEHEMIDDQLLLVVEQLLKGDGPVWSFEYIVLLDLDHWHACAKRSDLIRVSRQFFLLLEQLDTGCAPFFLGCYLSLDK